MKQKLCAILILIMLLLNSSLMTVISVAIEAVNNAADLTNEEVGEDTKVSNVDLKLNADYLVNNVENKVELTATLKTDDTKYSLFKNPTISIEMPSEIVDVVIGTPYLMYNNQIFTITKSEVVTNEVGNKVINVQLEGEQTEYETDSILEGTNIVIPASIVVSKQIDTMVSNIKLRYTNEIKCQTIYEANGEECEKQEINLINKIVRNLPAIASDEEAKTIEFEQDGIKVEIIEKVGNTVIPDNGTLYEQQIVKNVVKFTNNSTTVKPVSFTANIPDGLTYTEFIPQEIVHNEEYDAYYIPNHPSYKTDETKKQLNVNIEELGVGETKETYFELQVNNLEGVSEKVTSIDYILINSNGEVNTYTISNTIIEAEIKATLQCYRLNDRNDWQYALTFTNITDRILTNINVHCDIDKNFDINKIYKVESSGKHVYYDINNVQDNTFVYSIESLEPNKKYYIAVDGVTKDIYEDETNTYEMKGVYKIYGDEINTYVSNETSVIAGIEKVKVSMTSNKDGQELKMNDEIIYTINIENIGNEKLAMRKFSKIRIFDFIPEELEPISATYNNFITNTQYTENAGDYLGAPIEIDTYTEEQKSLDLTYKIVKEGATEQETPNFDLDLSIPYGKIITIVIKAKVKMITEKAEIANTVTVEGNGMITKTASVANIVLPYNYDQIQNPVNPDKPDTEGTTGGIIDDTEESTNPEDPSEIKVTDVEITPTKTTLKVGQSLDLIATIKPDNATNKGINWSTSDENIAVVMNGTVIAIKEGTAIITVTTQDGSKTATCEVTVSGNSSIPTDPEKPDESEKPVNPNMPEKPDNPNIQEKPEDENINISGMAWIDENQNGKRDEEESPYSNMTVMLYNYQTKKLVSIDGIAIEKKTDQNGKYKFTDLQAGKYIAIFWYDTTNYELTEYQKVGISSIENSDAVSKNVTLQGEKRLAGLTDIIILEQNTENIDIGLVEKKESDFSIQKYISKITIKTNKETKTYTYDNKNFAKVEVHSKQINGAQAIIEYKMVVKNEGELPGRVDLIVDEIPNDLKFYSELNSSWYKSKAGIATTALSREIIGVGESREVTIVLTKNLNGNNIGTVSNTAKIVQTSNEKAIEEQNIENNTAKAEILITVSTGMIKWIGLVIGVLIVLGFIVFIAIQDKKIMKTISFVFIFGVFIFGNIMQVYAEGLRDDGFSDTGWTYTVDGVTDLHCTTPDNTMCPTSEYHWIISTTKGEQRGSAWLDREEKPDNIEFTLQNATINENVKMVLNGDKIKLGPFRINVLRGTEIATDVKIKSCNVTYYTKVNDDGSIPYETLSVNVPVGQDFYINLPKDTIQVVKIDINADYSYNSREYYKTYYRYYYEIGAKGVNENHKSYTGEIVSCVTQYLAGNAQILGKDIEEEYYKDITKTFTRELTINGPWTPPGSLTIEKIAFDREEVEIDGQKVKVEKTYIPNVEIKVMKGTDENASRYFQLFNTAGNRISEINVSGTIQFPNPSLYTAGSNEDSDISVLVNGKQYTAKWTGSKDRATKLVLLDGKVTMSNLKCGVGAYTVIETKNPNYGYDPEDNTNLKGSIQAITPFDTNEITIVNGKSTGGLVIRKVDYSDNTPLANVEFLVEAKIDDDEKGYLKIIVDDSPNVTKFKNSDYAKVVKGYCKIKDMIPTDTAPISYVSNPEEATKFITNEEGTVTIANLPATPVVGDSKPKVGKTKWYYRAEEIWNPNYGYSKEKYYEFGRTKYRADDTSAWAVDTSTGWKLLPTIWLYDTNHPEYKSYGTPYRITVTNQKLIGNIYVTKKDAESEEDVNLAHIGFVLKAKLTETTENSNSSMFNMNDKYIKVKIDQGSHEDYSDGYAKYTEGNVRIADGEFTGSTTDVIQYVDDQNEATVFYTDVNGELLIANLLKSTNGNNYIEYRFEEYDSKTYGYVAEIGEGYTNVTVEFTDYEKTDSFVERPETSPYIPAGFSKVDGTDLNTGLVIEDGDGNQFVWIEVPRTAEVYKTAGLRIAQFTDEEYKKIETDLQAYTSVYRNGTSATDEHDGNVSATGLEKYEYYTQKRKMLKSIYNYGGFYIGRYETGIEDKSRTQESESPVETPVIKANAYPYTWLRCSQAQDIARNMYSGDYTSSLMFGVQWDLVLKYLETKGATQAELNEDSTEWGNYTNNGYTITNKDAKFREPSSSWENGAYGEKQAGYSLFLSTGASDEFSKQNIYDLAGNVREWTLEKSNETNYPCVYRGGSFDTKGSETTASERLNLNSEFKNGNVGFRIALYTNEDPGYTQYYDRTLENEIDRVTKDGWVTPKIEFTSKNPTKEQCTKVEILNYKQTGNLEINKTDSEQDIKLENVKFVLKAKFKENGKEVERYVKAIVDDGASSLIGTGGYAIEVKGECRIKDITTSISNQNESTSLQFVENINDATRFITNSNGQIRIVNLLVNTNGVDKILYKVEEVENDIYGYSDEGNQYTIKYETTDGWIEVDRLEYNYTSVKVFEGTDSEENNTAETIPYLPTGFTYVDNTDLSRGLVIQDLSGNQYVWVEVPRNDSVYTTAGLNIEEFTDEEYKKIEKDLQTYTATYRNASFVDEFYSEDLTGLDNEEYYKQKKKMLKSVYINGGFYIGRYETGIAEGYRTTSGIPTGTPVIQKGAYPYNYVTCKQAQTIATNMGTRKYSTSLMFGLQWDLVLKYLETYRVQTGYITSNSTSWGNYYNSQYEITDKNTKYYVNSWKNDAYGQKASNSAVLLSTGASEKFSKQNIFDLAGNLAEWTLEYNSNTNTANRQAGRGGFYSIEGNGSFAAAGRGSSYTAKSNINVGFRVALYKNEGITANVNKNTKFTLTTVKNIKQTGNLIITKVDSRDNNEKLPNVEFVLKAQREQESSNKNDRYKNIDGKYVKAQIETLKNGGKRITNIEYVSDIKEATVFKTNSDGKCTIYNLLMSTNGINKIMYKLIETKNPNYGYLADTENFSDFKVTFESDRLNGEYIVPKRQTSLETSGKTAGNDTKVTVKNEQIYTRLSGIVWEDISLGKDNNIDNIYKEDSNDALINGITVYLYKDGEQVATTTTNENGYYEFGTKHKENGIYENLDYWKNNNNIPQRDGNNLISKAVNENGNLVINDLNKYSIEFEYDGLRFTTVAQGEDSISSRGKEIAKATEIIKDRNRESVDASFTTVYGGTSADENGVIKGQTNKYDLKYNANTPKNNQSQYIEHWGYSDYGTNNNGKKYFTLTQPENGEDYIIRASVKGSYITWKQEYASIDMIPYINQGIYRKEQPDLAIESDIEKVEVTVDKYTNTYIYSGRNLDNENIGEETHGFDVEVKYGNKTETSYSSRGLDTYTRPLYASDLAYNLTDPDNELMQVYVTYQIVVKNQSNTLTTKVNEIVNYFDSRYDIENVNGATYDANSIEDVSDENQTVKYKKVKLKLDETIKHGQKGSVITITFKLNKDALIVIAHERAMLYNVSEIASYSTFYGDETLCAENKTANENQVVNKIYSGIDTDSAPGSANIVAEVENENNIIKIKVNGDGIEYDYSTPNVKLSDSSKATFEDDTGLAPSLVLGIDEKDPTRGLNGIVFEDNAVFEDCDNEEHRQTGIHVGETRVGNGIYEKGENLVKDTKVELYNVNKTQGDVQEGNATTKAKLYKLIIEGNMAHVEIEDAVTWSKDDISDNSGKTYNYELMGIIPDEYLIRYSYGNIEETAEDGTATSRITQIVKNGGKLKEVAAMDYKSTILKSDIIIQALDIFNIPDRIKDLNWILAEEKNGDDIIRYSDAADDLNLRNDQEDIYYGKHYELNTMSADTAVFEVGVEFTENIDKINNSGEIIGRETKTKELVLEDTNGDGKFGIGDKVVRVPEYSIVNSYQDFGIIERAIPDQYIEKTVSNIKIVLQNGQELINGNPYEDELSYVKALKMGNNPRKEAQKSIFVEIDNEILQGSTLYLKYDIKAYNNSELDYKYNKKDTNNPNSPDVPNTPGNRFYYLGEKGEGVEVQNSILKVVDYMDNELVLDTETMTKEGKWKTIDIDYLIGKGENSEGKIFISDKVKTLLENNKYTILVTDAFKELQPGQQATIQTYASKLLSVGEGDLKFVNHAEIIHTTGTRKVNNSTPGNYEPVQQNPNEQDDDNVKVVITPPTGLPLSKINQ